MHGLGIITEYNICILGALETEKLTKTIRKPDFILVNVTGQLESVRASYGQLGSVRVF